MAARKSRSIPKAVAKRTPTAVLSLTIPVTKPRNRIAMNPLLKKSAAHTEGQSRVKRERGDALEVQQGVQDALNRRHGDHDNKSGTGGHDGG